MVAVVEEGLGFGDEVLLEVRDTTNDANSAEGSLVFYERRRESGTRSENMGYASLGNHLASLSSTKSNIS